MLDAIFALHGTCVVAAANTDASSLRFKSSNM